MCMTSQSFVCSWWRPTWLKCPAISCYWLIDSAMYMLIKIYSPVVTTQQWASAISLGRYPHTLKMFHHGLTSILSKLKHITVWMSLYSYEHNLPLWGSIRTHHIEVWGNLIWPIICRMLPHECTIKSIISLKFSTVDRQYIITSWRKGTSVKL